MSGELFFSLLDLWVNKQSRLSWRPCRFRSAGLPTLRGHGRKSGPQQLARPAFEEPSVLFYDLASVVQKGYEVKGRK
jgi:hypothetical protein